MKLKKKELAKAKRIIRNFCKLNNIIPPITKVKNNLDCLGCYHDDGSRDIYINLEATGLASKRNNPAMTRENTIIGSLVHEFAHYIHYITPALRVPLKNKFEKLKEPLTHYWEIDIEEDIAESIRLFVLNPSLLQEGRPKRYKILSRYFKPIKSAKHYTELLKGLDLQKRRAVALWLKGTI